VLITGRFLIPVESYEYEALVVQYRWNIPLAEEDAVCEELLE
jgi:hypothetical protein